MKKNQTSKHLYGKGLKIVCCFILIGFFSAGCNGSHQSVDNMSNGVKEGVFLDSAVQGIEYKTATQSGMTDENGTFRYMDGETIAFTIGDVMLGQAEAGSVLTPVDLVPGAVDETHPTVTNICRFLQTLDADYDPENGIVIPKAAIREIEGRNINFEMTPEKFESDAEVEMFMDTYGAMNGSDINLMMVSIEDARAHMRLTMLEIMAGNGMMTQDPMK